MFKVDQKILRVVDANLNRAKEGLRVCEDVCRFLLDDKLSTRQFKNVRHDLTEIVRDWPMVKIIASRNIETDIGRGSTAIEFRRKNTADIFFANCQRIKESVRVLEEFSKIMEKKSTEKIKRIRYKVYALEKRVTAKI